MSWAAIRSAIETRLGAVSGVENVHALQRHHVQGFNDPNFASLYLNDSDALNTWIFGRVSVEQTHCLDDDDTIYRHHLIRARGHFGLVDADTTEHTFNATIDATIDDLNEGDRTLGGACFSYSLPQVTNIQHVTFYDVLAHDCTIEFTVEEHVSRTAD